MKCSTNVLLLIVNILSQFYSIDAKSMEGIKYLFSFRKGDNEF
jgi:hypothetical protein